MPFETQPDALPTNKLLTGSAVAALVGPAAAEIYPELVNAPWDGTATTLFVSSLAALLAGLLLGWLPRDRAGVKAGD